MSTPRRRSFAVIGLGSFGATIARELARFDNYVIGVDRDKAAVNRLAEELPLAAIADGCDEDAMKEIGVGDCDVAVIAMGEDLESSIVSAITAKVIGVDEVWAKAVSRMHHRILSRIGVDRVVRPDEEMGRHIAQMLHNPLVVDYVSLGNGFHLVNILVPERLDGKSLSDLDLRETFDLRCVGVMRGSSYEGSDEVDCTLETDDRLLLLGKRDDLSRFADSA